MSTVNRNPAEINIHVPLNDAYKQRITFDEVITGAVTAKLYDSAGEELPDFTVTEISVAEGSAYDIVLPDTDSETEGRWRLIEDEGGADERTFLAGRFLISKAFHHYRLY